MDNNIYFSIPDFWDKWELNTNFIYYFIDQRNKFRDNVVIDNIFGSFPCIWNGGRSVQGHCDYNNIIKTITPFIEQGISITYTFNNHLINEQMTNDWIGNQILKITDEFNTQYNVHNRCTVATDILYDYIKDNYPSFTLAWSTATHKLLNEDVDVINQLSEKDIVVLPYTMNNNFDKLKQLTHPENIEILCMDEGCQDNCPYRKDHYLETDEYTLCIKPQTFSSQSFEESHGCCKHPNRDPYYYSNNIKNNYVVSIDNIEQNYLPLGINKFKISGRSVSDSMVVNVIENYVNWLAKPEYKDEVRNKLIIDNLCKD